MQQGAARQPGDQRHAAEAVDRPERGQPRAQRGGPRRVGCGEGVAQPLEQEARERQREQDEDQRQVRLLRVLRGLRPPRQAPQQRERQPREQHQPPAVPPGLGEPPVRRRAGARRRRRRRARAPRAPAGRRAPPRGARAPRSPRRWPGARPSAARESREELALHQDLREPDPGDPARGGPGRRRQGCAARPAAHLQRQRGGDVGEREGRGDPEHGPRLRVRDALHHGREIVPELHPFDMAAG